MNRTEAERFVRDILCGIYAGWNPTSEQENSWCISLSRFDWDIAKSAVHQSTEQTNFNKPPKKTILSIARTLKDSQRTIIKENTYGEVGIFIQYRGGGPSALQAGYYIPLVFGRDDKIPRPDRVDVIAEKRRQDLTQEYGGQWVVFKRSSYRRMNELRRELRGYKIQPGFQKLLDKRAGVKEIARQVF